MSQAPAIHKKTGYHHGDLRAQLITAIQALIETDGPDGFSVSDACRAAGVSTAAPYRHFRDKEAMVIAAAADGLNRLRLDMLAALDGKPPGTVASIAAIGETYVAFARREPGLFRLMFGLTRTHGQHAEIMEVGRACYAVLLTEVARFLGRDSIDDAAVRRTGFSLWTVVHGMSFLLIDGKVDVAAIPMDIGAMIRDMTARLLAEPPG